MTIASPRTGIEHALGRVDATVDQTFGRWHVPGIAYGIIVDGRLVHSRGLGTLRVGEDATPTADSVFRIASMTKSFTAATVLSLRDEGRLRLDDPIGEHLPELVHLRYPTTNSPLVTIRHLLTMTAGFPTDDPWGDRQQGLDLGSFSRLLTHGLSFAWAPGTRFEYSNTGYGILGRLITNVAGCEYRDVVRERLLEPLGMRATTYLESDVPEERKALGYLWRDGRYIPEPIDPYGALASMGGIFTTIQDLSTWVVEFLDAWPPRDASEGGHPLKRSTRREMQQPMVDAGTRLIQPTADAVPDVERMGYGFGLFLVDDLRLGRIVTHGGGYPGFGSHMRWHPASGLGVVMLTNHRYGPSGVLAKQLMADLLREEVVRPRRVAANQPTLAARDAVEALLREWDDAAAEALFAMNVDLDEPIASRKAFIEDLHERHGSLERDDTEATESESPFHLRWWLAGDRGRVHAEILLSPELPPRVQALALTSVPEPPAILANAAAEIVAALNPPDAPGPVSIDWPSQLAVGPEVNVASVVRAMRAAEARFAPLELGPAIEGDGETKATFRLTSPRGRLELGLTVDPVKACLESISLAPVELTPPDLD